MSNCAVVFVSAVAVEPVEPRLQAIMKDAAQFNKSVGVTAITLFDKRRFLTYMEGTADAVGAALLRASDSTSHEELIQLARGSIGQRRVAPHHMLLLEVSSSAIREFVRADWTNFSQRLSGRDEPVTGMERLAAAIDQHLAVS